MKQFDVVVVDLNPTMGSEMKKVRPCVVVSPTDMNQALNTVIIAPMTEAKRGWKFRPIIVGPTKTSELALDQIRAIDKSRIGKVIGSISESEQEAVSNILSQMFQ